ncbi:MAG: PorV/PorQ family protein [candidate division KSB1 bacterium]|nr:PorV/PorQ family protein [candidate division KSB1 bacterium]
MKKSLFVIFIVFCLVLSAEAQTKVGTTAAGFLQIGPASRIMSMGEAAGALATDVTSLYWNPALGADLTQNQVYFNHISWFADIKLEYGILMLNLGNWGKVAASFYTLNSGQIEVTTEERPEGTGEKYDAQDLMIGLTYARRLTDRFGIGGTVKFIRSTIWNMNASTMAMDLGLAYQTPLQPVVIAMSISNFGGEMQMTGTDAAIRFDPDPRVSGNNDGIVGYQATRSWDLPVNFRFGISYKLLNSANNHLVINSDILYPNNNQNYVNVGAEYRFMNICFLRTGYRQLFLDRSEGGLSLGMGLKYRNLQVDYGFADHGRLNAVQYFALGFMF